MYNNDFNIEYEEDNKKKIVLNKKTIIIITVIIAFIILMFLVLNKKEENKYSISVESPSIMYIDKPIGIEVKINGDTKNLELLETSAYLETEGIIELTESWFSGEKGLIQVKPLSLGKEKITISSTEGADKYIKELASKTINITVCPKFDDNLVLEKELTIKKGQTKAIDINFGDEECSLIALYESINPSIAKVDENGIVKGINYGRTLINITNGINNITIYVNVIA